MPTPRLTVDNVLKFAREQAQLHAAMAPEQRLESQTLCKAVTMVWTLVKPRLGDSEDARQLDEMVRAITAQ